MPSTTPLVKRLFCICSGFWATGACLFVYELNEDRQSPASPYYLLAAPAPTSDSRPLPNMVDVAIVGGGFAGLHTALLLSRRGISTAVFEARTVGSGASGVNGGMAIPGIAAEQEDLAKWYGRDAAGRLWQQTLDGAEWIKRVVREHHIECDLVEEGYATVRTRRSTDTRWDSTTPQKGPSQVEGLVLASPRLLPGCSADVLRESFSVNPLALCRGLASAVRQCGGDVFEFTEVTTLEEEHIFSTTEEQQHPWKLSIVCQQTAEKAEEEEKKRKGSCRHVRARHVICATNAVPAWFSRWHSMLHVPIYSAILVTPVIPGHLLNTVLPTQANLCDDRRVLAYFRRLSDGRVLWGGRMPSAVRLPTTSVGAMLHADLLATFPQLGPHVGGNASDCFVWTGKMVAGFRKIPYVGCVRHAKSSFSSISDGIQIQKSEELSADLQPTPQTRPSVSHLSPGRPALWISALHFCHGVVPTAAAALALDEAIGSGSMSRLKVWEAVRPAAVPPVPDPFKQLVAQGISWGLLAADHLWP
jgi:gamma-glutamylputrescine oxidase